ARAAAGPGRSPPAAARRPGHRGRLLRPAAPGPGGARDHGHDPDRPPAPGLMADASKTPAPGPGDDPLRRPSTGEDPTMAKFVTIGYGDRDGYDRTDPAVLAEAHASD